MGMRNGDCRVVHREFIQDVTGGTGAPSIFKVSQLAINPGQAAVFPWLSSVARNFESYRFKKLRFCYETEAPSSLGGSLLLSVDYDANDAAPTTKQQAMAYRNAVRSAPWEPCCHTSAQEDLNKLKTHFVRPNTQPANTDLKLYDVGNLFIVSQNVSTALAILGELYVEYDIELLTPVYDLQSGSGTFDAGSGITAAAPFGTAASGLATGPILLSIAGTPTLTINNVVVGQEISLYSAIIGTVITAINYTTPVGMTAKSSPVPNLINAAQTDALVSATYLVTAVPCSINLAVTATTVTDSNSVVSILEPKPLF
jgi:hypothetical protein